MITWKDLLKGLVAVGFLLIIIFTIALIQTKEAYPREVKTFPY